MRSFIPVLIALTLAPAIRADETAKARLLEKEGDSLGARSVLRAAAATNDPEAQLAYAEFLHRYRDPEARAAYEKLLSTADGPRKNQIARRLVLLNLLAGDRDSAAKFYEVYKNTGGGDLTASVLQASRNTTKQPQMVSIPGPLRSFARMAALSPDLAPEEILGGLARNIVTNGYQASASSDSLDQTEYLKLVFRYLSQARELDKLATDDHAIKIENCESSKTADLLRVLGYRMRGGCGSEVVLETVNATRAFLTIDSGFPLAQLEQSLRTNRPFVYEFQPSQVPVLYDKEYWLSALDKANGEFIDVFLSDPALCRLYLGLSKLDSETAEQLRKQMPASRLKAFAHVLDFYGGMFQIQKGVALVPGGEKAWPAWTEFVGGKSPKDGAAFFERLLTKDDGWAAAYYDALARISGPTRDYLLEPKRMNRFYMAMRGKITSPGPARPVFRASTDLMLLTQRLRLEPNGKPHVPGNIEIWKNLFIAHPHGKYDGKLTKAATGWKEPDDLIEALFALCRKAVENEPLKIYMAMTDLNRYRSAPLEPATVDRLAREYRQYGSQYSIFAEAATLSDKTILRYLDVSESITSMRDHLLKADTAGTMQSEVGLWQIFVRQGSIRPDDADAALSNILSGFDKIRNGRELFDTGRAGVKALLAATKTAENVSAQDRLIDLLAGRAAPADADSHRQLVENMIRILEAQRLINVDTIFEMADNLESLTRGEKLNKALVTKLAARINEIQLPRASMSSAEKNTLAFGYWTERHVEQERKTILLAQVEKAAAGNDADKLRDIRGLLAPFLRDTLVGFNYVHYAPPGAQILLTNPLFVRTHDFLGVQGSQQTWRTTEVFGSGWPSSAGGRLVGSLSGLPYALAEAEQNFLIPTREQALIWGDLVPQMILMAKVARWWDVTPCQTHWVALHMSQGEHLIAEAALNPQRFTEVIDLLNRHAPPVRVHRIAEFVGNGSVSEAIDNVTPAELFALASEWWETHKDDNGLFAQEAKRLMADEPQKVSFAAISRAFGTPKPTLTGSYQPELLNMRTFPTLMGYSSRIMAESWESNLLFYAALADEVHMPPSQLNLAVPEWTQQTVEKIFATHLEDWPALLRSLRLVGNDVRAKARKQFAVEQKASLQ
jgi:hypothetical protein